MTNFTIGILLPFEDSSDQQEISDYFLNNWGLSFQSSTRWNDTQNLGITLREELTQEQKDLITTQIESTGGTVIFVDNF